MRLSTRWVALMLCLSCALLASPFYHSPMNAVVVAAASAADNPSALTPTQQALIDEMRAGLDQPIQTTMQLGAAELEFSRKLRADFIESEVLRYQALNLQEHQRKEEQSKASEDGVAAAATASQSIRLTVDELRQHDGTDPNKPIYISIRRKIYDVTAGASYYRAGRSYSYLSGREIARGLVTGCFETTGFSSDVRGLNEDQLDTIAGWSAFFKNKYGHVGYLRVPKIDVHTPLPDDSCTEKESYSGIPMK